MIQYVMEWLLVLGLGLRKTLEKLIIGIEILKKNEKQINKLVINRNDKYANFGLITVTGIGLEYNSNGVVTSFQSEDYITTFKKW